MACHRLVVPCTVWPPVVAWWQCAGLGLPPAPAASARVDSWPGSAGPRGGRSSEVVGEQGELEEHPAPATSDALPLRCDASQGAGRRGAPQPLVTGAC